MWGTRVQRERWEGAKCSCSCFYLILRWWSLTSIHSQSWHTISHRDLCATIILETQQLLEGSSFTFNKRWRDGHLPPKNVTTTCWEAFWVWNYLERSKSDRSPAAWWRRSRWPIVRPGLPWCLWEVRPISRRIPRSFWQEQKMVDLRPLEKWRIFRWSSTTQYKEQ